MAESIDPTDPTNEKTPLIQKKGDDDDDEDTGTVNSGIDWDNIDFEKIPIDPSDPDKTPPY